MFYNLGAGSVTYDILFVAVVMIESVYHLTNLVLGHT